MDDGRGARGPSGICREAFAKGMLLCECGGGWRIRTTEGLRQQIYSLPQLTAMVTPRPVSRSGEPIITPLYCQAETGGFQRPLVASGSEPSYGLTHILGVITFSPHREAKDGKRKQFSALLLFHFTRSDQ